MNIQLEDAIKKYKIGVQCSVVHQGVSQKEKNSASIKTDYKQYFKFMNILLFYISILQKINWNKYN